MMVPRPMEIEEPMVSAFMTTDEWRYYCMDAEVWCNVFIANVLVALEMDGLYNCKIYVTTN